MTPGGRARRGAWVLLCAAGLAACGGSAGRLAREWCRGVPGAETRLRTELLFGRDRPGGGTVSEGEWRAFLAEEVTPRFPDGLTVVEAAGQYRDRSGRIVTEPSKVLVLVHGPGEQSRAAIEAIRARYRTRFEQESVLLVTAPACVAF